MTCVDNDNNVGKPNTEFGLESYVMLRTVTRPLLLLLLNCPRMRRCCMERIQFRVHIGSDRKDLASRELTVVLYSFK